MVAAQPIPWYDYVIKVGNYALLEIILNASRMKCLQISGSDIDNRNLNCTV